ncbi:MAG: imidazole glycerol phosphate synthase subunit HisH [Henriciella sp.]
MSEIALIDYGSGNLHSAARALRVAAAASGSEAGVSITSDPDHVYAAERIVLPGVGHFADCAAGLRRLDGMVAALTEAVMQRGKPFFGICVGQQLLASEGLEDSVTEGLNWVPGTVDRIEPGPGYRIPHMGWNGLQLCQDHAVMQGLGNDPHVYFTHSYAFKEIAARDIAARVDYGQSIIAAIARDNIFATQFHPEKSQKIGLKILSNFINWRPQ